MPIDAKASERPLGLAAVSDQASDRRVPRRQLLARLVERSSRPVVVISGPAGSGKSTLAEQLRDVDPRAHVMARLADHDDDPIVLAGRLIDALELVGPAATLTRAAVTAVEPGFSAMLLPALTQLASSRGRPYVLVIDDAQVVRQRQCSDLLSALAAGVPAGSRLVLLTREGAPRWVARTRAEGRLDEIGPSDLAFDVDEAQQLLQNLDLHLEDRDFADLLARSEGWAVGLYLSGLAMKRHGSSIPRGLAPSPPHASDPYLLDYVESEVLEPLSAAERAFLVRTAVLEELYAPLCDAVLERADSWGVLAGLHRRSQLVMSVDGDAGGRFRCHQLLREALLAELERDEPAGRSALNARAARWYAHNDDIDAAVRHATAAEDMALVSELIWPRILDCVGSGRLERLVVWLSGLSERQISADRWLSLASAWSGLQGGDPDHLLRWLSRARSHAGRHWRRRLDTDEYAASLAVLEAIVGEGGLEDSVLLCDGALAGLPPDSGFLAPAAFVSGVCHTLLRRPEEARVRLEQARSLGRALDVPIIEADALSWQGVLAISSGDTIHGSRLIGEATQVIAANHLDRLASAAHCITAQSLLQALTHHPDATTTLAKARSLTALIPSIAPWFGVCGRLVQARAAIHLEDGALARTLISDARRAMTPDLAASLAQDMLEYTAASLRTLSRDGVSAAALTAAEMRVLQFLPSHLTLPMIGEHLFLSQNTVKTHALAIYRKLGVSSRSDAVVVARSLGLVEGPPRD